MSTLLRSKSSAGAAASVVRVRLSTLSLNAAAAPHESVTVEVDMPGEDVPLRSKPVKLRKGSAALGF